MSQLMTKHINTCNNSNVIHTRTTVPAIQISHHPERLTLIRKIQACPKSIMPIFNFSFSSNFQWRNSVQKRLTSKTINPVSVELIKVIIEGKIRSIMNIKGSLLDRVIWKFPAIA